MTKITATYELNADRDRIYWTVDADGEVLGTYHANTYATFHGHDDASGTASQVHGWAWTPLSDTKGPGISLRSQATAIARNAGFDDFKVVVRRGTVVDTTAGAR